MSEVVPAPRPVLLVLASTYPRWRSDPEPSFVHELARRLTARYQVVVVCPHAPGARRREILDGVRVERYRYAPERWETLVNDGGILANLRRHRMRWLLLPGFVLAQAWRAWRVVRGESVAVIHAHWLLPQGLIAAVLRRCAGVPYVVTSHGADLYSLRGRWATFLKRRVAAAASVVTVVSAPMRDELVRLGMGRDDVRVEPMGVDLSERFTVDAEVARVPDRLLFVGRLVEKKGLRYLLEAMPRILAARPGATLRIVGFGPEADALRAQVAALGLGAVVSFQGAVAQSALADEYRRASVFVAPFVRAANGDQEGLGLVLVEAAGCGCPVVAGDVPAVHDVIVAPSIGVVVDARDLDALADAIVAAMSTADPAVDRCRAAAVSAFDWSSRADAYAALFDRCLRQAPSARSNADVASSHEGSGP